MKEYITLTYVPNQFCNFGCKYCYLGKLTDNTDKHTDITSKLKDAVDEIKKAGYGVHRVHLHGAEVSTVPVKYLDEMFEYINTLFQEDMLERKIATNGIKAQAHIKTNLYNFDKLQSMYEKHQVSISGSFDLPFSLHDKFRVDKKGNSTLDKTLANIKLLKDYKYGKGLSCVITKAHLEQFDEVVRDLKHMHEVIGFDMIKNFYFMFGYDSKASEDKFNEKIHGTEMLTQDELVEFYNKIKDEFTDTIYEEAIKYNWFKEFQSGYCTDMNNCGDSQYLLQKNGDMYPCHRTQPDAEFKYGNIFTDGFEKIVDNAHKVVSMNEVKTDLSDNCIGCEYFKYCQAGCTLVRKETGMSKSYTCSIQRELYKDNPTRYPKMNQEEVQGYVRDFILRNNPSKTSDFVRVHPKRNSSIITPELYTDEQKLDSIIQRDAKLKIMYKSGIFKLIVNDEVLDLEPQEFSEALIYEIKSTDVIKLQMSKEYFLINCSEEDLPSNNLMINMLRNTINSYGDEGRSKQEHTWDERIYYKQLLENSEVDGDDIVFDISNIIHRHKNSYIDGVFNSVFFTTKQARLYHYEKHKKNAFYHIQAINLPFHNFKFIYKEV